MAYREHVAHSFSLLVSGLSLSPTKFLQFIVFVVAVTGVTYVLGSCDLECNVTYDEDSNVCAVKCEPSTDAAVVRVNNNVLGYDDRCLDQQTWNKFYCLWKENGLSVGAKIKSDSGIFKFKYDPAITSCDDKWCELDIEFANGTCSGVEVSGSTCRKSENVPSVTPSATSTVEPSDPPGIDSKNELFFLLIIPVALLILVVAAVIVVVVCCVGKKTRGNGRGPNLNGGHQLHDMEHDGGPKQKSMLMKKDQ